MSLRAERESARTSKITNDRLNPIGHRMLYSCTHMATVTVGVKGLKADEQLSPIRVLTLRTLLNDTIR